MYDLNQNSNEWFPIYYILNINDNSRRVYGPIVNHQYIVFIYETS